MATQTTNYNLPVVEGSDTVNLLTVLPDLATKVDAQMKINANTGIQRGTHTKSGTVNSVTVPTNLATGTFFTFVASDDFTEGDSFTFNGEVIAARTPEGKALKTGAFTINQNVLCCNYNGILTIYTNQSATAVDLSLDDSSNNPIANSAVTTAINGIKTDIGNADISGVGNNVKNAIINLDGDITVMNNAITGLDGRVTELDNDVTVIKNNITKFIPIIGLEYGQSRTIEFDFEPNNIVILTTAPGNTIFNWNKATPNSYDVCYGTTRTITNIGANFITSLSGNRMVFKNLENSTFTSIFVFYS